MSYNTSSNANLRGQRSIIRLLHLIVLALQLSIALSVNKFARTITGFCSGKPMDNLSRLLADIPIEHIDAYLFAFVLFVGIIAIIAMLPLSIN